jgi:hypothetical protein
MKHRFGMGSLQEEAEEAEETKFFTRARIGKRTLSSFASVPKNYGFPSGGTSRPISVTNCVGLKGFVRNTAAPQPSASLRAM